MAVETRTLGSMDIKKESDVYANKERKSSHRVDAQANIANRILGLIKGSCEQLDNKSKEKSAYNLGEIAFKPNRANGVRIITLKTMKAR